MAKKKAVVSADTPETREQILKVIQATPEPVTVAQVAKLLTAPHKFKEAQLTPVIESLASESQLNQLPPKTAKGKPRYWDRGLQDLGRILILALIDKKGPQGQSELRKATKQLADADFAAAFQKLIATNSLFEHPPLGKKKTPSFGMQPPSPDAYLRDIGTQLAKTVALLIAAQVSADDLRRSLVQLVESTGISFANRISPGSIPSPQETDLLGLMRRIESGAENGALVAARDLRRAAQLEKGQFDHAVLDLARQGRLMLHRHDFANGLSASERDELVTDGAGTYYVGMAIRQQD